MNDFKHYRGRGRGGFQHNNNFRGAFNGARRGNPNAFPPMLPLPHFRDNKHRWQRPPHVNMWRGGPPRMQHYMRPQMPPPFLNQRPPIDSRPISPLPGSEEARQKVIAEASARIKEQLNLNERTGSEIENNSVQVSQISASVYQSFDDVIFPEILSPVVPNIENAKPPEKNLKKRIKKPTESTSVQELRNKILTQFTYMSKGKIQSLVNNPGSSKYDGYLQHLVRDMRLHLSSELRNMYNNRESDSGNNEMIDHFNSIVPDLGVELVSLPNTMVAELSKILQFDVNNEEIPSINETIDEPIDVSIDKPLINETYSDNTLVEPEDMFKQAEKLLLTTDFLDTSFDLNEIPNEPENQQNVNSFSPDASANFEESSHALRFDQLNNDPFMHRSPLCNDPPPNLTFTAPEDFTEDNFTEGNFTGDNFTEDNYESNFTSNLSPEINNFTEATDINSDLTSFIPLPPETDLIPEENLVQEKIDDSLTGLNEIPLPDSNPTFPNTKMMTPISRDSSPFSKKILEANLPDNSNPEQVFDQRNSRSSSIPASNPLKSPSCSSSPLSTGARSETNNSSNNVDIAAPKLFDFESVWVFKPKADNMTNVTSFLNDVISSNDNKINETPKPVIQNIPDEPIKMNKPKIKIELNKKKILTNTFKTNKAKGLVNEPQKKRSISLDERIKIMMKMKETNPKKPEDLKPKAQIPPQKVQERQIYKSKNQKKNERVKLLALQRRKHEENKIKVKVHVENFKASDLKPRNQIINNPTINEPSTAKQDIKSVETIELMDVSNIKQERTDPDDVNENTSQSCPQNQNIFSTNEKECNKNIPKPKLTEDNFLNNKLSLSLPQKTTTDNADILEEKPDLTNLENKISLPKHTEKTTTNPNPEINEANNKLASTKNKPVIMQTKLNIPKPVEVKTTPAKYTEKITSKNNPIILETNKSASSKYSEKTTTNVSDNLEANINVQKLIETKTSPKFIEKTATKNNPVVMKTKVNIPKPPEEKIPGLLKNIEKTKINLLKPPEGNIPTPLKYIEKTPTKYNLGTMEEKINLPKLTEEKTTTKNISSIVEDIDTTNLPKHSPKYADKTASKNNPVIIDEIPNLPKFNIEANKSTSLKFPEKPVNLEENKKVPKPIILIRKNLMPTKAALKVIPPIDISTLGKNITIPLNIGNITTNIIRKEADIVENKSCSEKVNIIKKDPPDSKVKQKENIVKEFVKTFIDDKEMKINKNEDLNVNEKIEEHNKIENISQEKKCNKPYVHEKNILINKQKISTEKSPEKQLIKENQYKKDEQTNLYDFQEENSNLSQDTSDQNIENTNILFEKIFDTMEHTVINKKTQTMADKTISSAQNIADRTISSAQNIHDHSEITQKEKAGLINNKLQINLDNSDILDKVQSDNSQNKSEIEVDKSVIKEDDQNLNKNLENKEINLNQDKLKHTSINKIDQETKLLKSTEEQDKEIRISVDKIGEISTENVDNTSKFAEDNLFENNSELRKKKENEQTENIIATDLETKTKLIEEVNKKHSKIDDPTKCTERNKSTERENRNESIEREKNNETTASIERERSKNSERNKTNERTRSNERKDKKSDRGNSSERIKHDRERSSDKRSDKSLERDKSHERAKSYERAKSSETKDKKDRGNSVEKSKDKGDRHQKSSSKDKHKNDKDKNETEHNSGTMNKVSEDKHKSKSDKYKSKSKIDYKKYSKSNKKPDEKKLETSHTTDDTSRSSNNLILPYLSTNTDLISESTQTEVIIIPGRISVEQQNLDKSEILNRLMNIDLEIQNLMQEKWNLYKQLNLTNFSNISYTPMNTSAIKTSAIIESQNKIANNQNTVEEIEKNTEDKIRPISVTPSEASTEYSKKLHVEESDEENEVLRKRLRQRKRTKKKINTNSTYSKTKNQHIDHESKNKPKRIIRDDDSDLDSKNKSKRSVKDDYSDLDSKNKPKRTNKDYDSDINSKIKSKKTNKDHDSDIDSKNKSKKSIRDDDSDLDCRSKPKNSDLDHKTKTKKSVKDDDSDSELSKKLRKRKNSPTVPMNSKSKKSEVEEPDLDLITPAKKRRKLGIKSEPTYSIRSRKSLKTDSKNNITPENIENTIVDTSVATIQSEISKSKNNEKLGKISKNEIKKKNIETEAIPNEDREIEKEVIEMEKKSPKKRKKKSVNTFITEDIVEEPNRKFFIKIKKPEKRLSKLLITENEPEKFIEGENNSKDTENYSKKTENILKGTENNTKEDENNFEIENNLISEDQNNSKDTEKLENSSKTIENEPEIKVDEKIKNTRHKKNQKDELKITVISEVETIENTFKTETNEPKTKADEKLKHKKHKDEIKITAEHEIEKTEHTFKTEENEYEIKADEKLKNKIQKNNQRDDIKITLHESVTEDNTLETKVDEKLKNKKEKKKQTDDINIIVDIHPEIVDEKKIKTETTNNNRNETKIDTKTIYNSTEHIPKEENINNNNENKTTEHEAENVKIQEHDNKSMKPKTVKTKEESTDEVDKPSSLRRSRRTTTEENTSQSSDIIIPPSTLKKRKRKTDEESIRSRSRSASKESDCRITKQDEDEQKILVNRKKRKQPYSESETSESGQLDENIRADKKINAKRKISKDSEQPSELVILNSPQLVKKCFVKLERIVLDKTIVNADEIPQKQEEAENKLIKIGEIDAELNYTYESIEEIIHKDLVRTENKNEYVNTEETKDVQYLSEVSAEINHLTKENTEEIYLIEENKEAKDIKDKSEDLKEQEKNSEEDTSLRVEKNLEKIIDKNDGGRYCFGHQKSILDIKILGDEFLAASEDGTIYKYCLKTGDLQDAFTGHTRAVTCMYIMSGKILELDSPIMYSGSLDCSLKCYNIDTAEVLHSVVVEQAIQCMDSAWGYIFLGTYEGLLFIYNIKKKLLNDQSLTIANATVLMIKATQEGSRQVLILASRKREIMVRDAFTGLLLRTMCQQQKPTIYSLLLDRSMVYCGTSDKGIFILDFNNGTQTGIYNSGKGVVCMIMYKSMLFAGCYDGMIYVYNTRTQKHIITIPGPGEGMLLSLAISHGMIIAGTKKDHLLKIWKIPQEILNQID